MNNNKSIRYELLDNLRGFSIFSMILYHAIWDCVFIFEQDWPFFRSDLAYIWQQSICWVFILVSGFCWNLGRKQLKRGLLVFGCGLLITLVTAILMPQQIIVFGILTLIGSSMLLLIPLNKLLRKVSPIIGTIGSFILFLITRNVNEHYLGFENLNLLKLPDFLYQNYFTAFLGFPSENFVSYDYFSLLPWLFLFVTGYFLYHLIINSSAKKVLTCGSIKPLSWVGRNSLLIYLIHQPIIYFLLYLIFLIIK